MGKIYIYELGVMHEFFVEYTISREVRNYL